MTFKKKLSKLQIQPEDIIRDKKDQSEWIGLVKGLVDGLRGRADERGALQAVGFGQVFIWDDADEVPLTGA
jgi:hypothetical protein